MSIAKTGTPFLLLYVTKKGFNAFPEMTQRMILVASEREEDGQMRTEPVESYSKVLSLANATYVVQHMHHHLH